MVRWKKIKGYSNYSVSDDGQVYSYNSEKVLKGRLDGRGNYLYVSLCNEGKIKNRNIHRLVAEQFVNNSDPKTLVQVDHIDNNPKNNHYTNLRWIDRHLNSLNSKVYKNNKSGVKGVHYRKWGEHVYWQACIQINKHEHRKSFKNKDDAIAWRKEMVEKHYNKDFYRDK